MNKKWMALVSFIPLICLITATAILAQNFDGAMDASTFLRKFVEAHKANNQLKMDETVKQAGPCIVYDVAIGQARMGIACVAEGKNGSLYFNTADAIAVTYANRYKKRGIIELLRRCENYDQKMCREKMEGDEYIYEGLSLYEKSQWKEASEEMTKALKIFRSLNDIAGEAVALEHLGLICDNLDRYTEALDHYQQALEAYLKIGDMCGEARVLNCLGRTYYKLGQYVESLDFYQQLLELLRKIGDVTIETALLNCIGDVYIKLNLYTRALSCYQQALEISRHVGDSASQAIAIYRLGRICDNLGRYTEALDHYQQLLEIYQETQDLSGEAVALFHLGQIYEKFGRYTEALGCNQQMLEISRKIGDMASQAIAVYGLGRICNRLCRYTEALEYYQQALEMSRKMGDVESEVIALQSLGRICDNLCRYIEALDYNQQALEISRTIGDVEGEAIALHNRGHTYEKLGRYAEALEHYQQELEISRKIGDVVGEAFALTGIGSVYTGSSQNTKALDSYQKALEMYQKSGEVAGEANVLTSIGSVYSEISQYDKALDYCQRALGMYREIEDMTGEATALLGIGNAYNGLSRYTEAVDHYQQSLEISRKIGNVAREASALGSIGNVYLGFGQFTEALDYHHRALGMYQKIGDVVGEATALSGIGNAYLNFGQYSEALDYYHRALKANQMIGNIGGEAGALDNIGIIYAELSQYTKALNYYQQALELFRIAGELKGEASVLYHLANAYIFLGRYNEAEEHHQQAFEIFRKIGDLAGEATVLGGIGAAYARLGQYTEALDFLQWALRMCLKIGDVSGETTNLANIGSVYCKLGQLNDAIPVLYEAIQKSKQLGALETVWRSHATLGDVLWNTAMGDEAFNHYKKAIEIIEEIYRHTSGFKEEERTSMIGDKKTVYRECVKLLQELHRESPNKGYDKEAFMISERAKSRIFQELMAKAGARRTFAGDETFQNTIGKEQLLIGEITRIRGHLSKENSKPEKERNDKFVHSLKAELLKTEQALRKLEKEIDAKYPRYADLKRPKALSVDILQKILRPDETVLAYCVGESKSVAFVIGKDRFKLVELDFGREELAELIKQFRQGLDNVTDYIDLTQWNPYVAYDLYQHIFQPLTNELRAVTQLYIVADDLLYTLPFEALVVQPVDTQAFNEAKNEGLVAYFRECGTLHYLIDDTLTVTYLPSASMLRSSRQYPKPGYGQWSKPLIAFADPIFGPEEEEETQTKVISKETALATQIIMCSAGSDNVLKRLAESADEAKAVAEEINGELTDIYLRERATEENVYLAELKAAQYLLFATHGLIGGEFSGVAEPALALTLVDNPKGRDGFLTMSEVLGLDLNAEIIGLSACNTYGQGEKAGSGEGFAGLTRSFMYAGAKSLLVTHWSVESQAASDLVVDAFISIKEESRPDEALWKAKIKMKESTFAPYKDNPDYKLSRSHPYFWAPFALVGEYK